MTEKFISGKTPRKIDPNEHGMTLLSPQTVRETT